MKTQPNPLHSVKRDAVLNVATISPEATRTAHQDNQDPPFNYDLERMKMMVESETITMPAALKTTSEIMQWLNGAI